MNEKYISNFQKIIQKETISKVGQTDLTKFREFHGLLAELFPSLWKVVNVEDFNGSLLIKWPGMSESSQLPLLFMNHHDVVEENGQWAHDPFGAEIEDGKIFGRGTIDTKSGLWAMLQAADDLASEGFVPSRDIYFESACNEEISGEGAEYISKVMKERGLKFALSLDEGPNIYDEGITIGIGEKGVTDIRFIAKSEGGHASVPPKNSALVRLGRFMAAADDNLDTLFPAQLNKETNTIQQTTIAFTMAEGSKGVNVLPKQASVTASLRSSHHQTVDGSIKAITEFAKQFDIDVEILDHGFTSIIADVNSEGYKILLDAINANFPGYSIKPAIMTGATDNRYMGIVSDATLRLCPFKISEDQAKTVHSSDENIDVKALEPAVEFYKYLMKK